MSLEMSDEHSRLKEEIVERIKSMVFLCMYCNSQNPIKFQLSNFKIKPAERMQQHFLFVLIVRNKFVVKIQDVGKIRK